MKFAAKVLLVLMACALALPSCPAFANEDDGEPRVNTGGEGGGSRGGGGNTAAVALEAATLIYQVMKHRNDKDSSGPRQIPPPSVITVVEFPIDPHFDGGATVEIEAKQNGKAVTYEIPATITPADKKPCCELTSLTFTNLWQEEVEVQVRGAKSQKLASGQSAEFSGNFGECTRLSVVGKNGSKLAEDVPLCCKDLAAGKTPSFEAVRLLGFKFKNKENCPGENQPPPPKAPEPQKTPPEDERTPWMPPLPKMPPMPKEGQPPAKTPPEDERTPWMPPLPKMPPMPKGGTTVQPPPAEVPPVCRCECQTEWGEGTKPHAEWVLPQGQNVIRINEHAGFKIEAWDFDVLAKKCKAADSGLYRLKNLLLEDAMKYTWTVEGAEIVGKNDGPALLIKAGKKPGWIEIRAEVTDQGGKTKDKPAPIVLKAKVEVVAVNGSRKTGAASAAAALSRKDAERTALEAALKAEESSHQSGACSLELDWAQKEGLKLYLKQGVRSPRPVLCVNDVTLIDARAQDFDVLQAQCGSEALQCPKTKETLDDPAHYDWKPDAGLCLADYQGASEIYEAPVAAAPVKIEAKVTDSALQQIDDPLVSDAPLKVCEIKDRFIEVAGKNKGKQAAVCQGDPVIFKAKPNPDDADCHKELLWFVEDPKGELAGVKEAVKDYPFTPKDSGVYQATGRCGCCSEDALQLNVCTVGPIEAKYLEEEAYGEAFRICSNTKVELKTSVPDIPACKKLKWIITRSNATVFEGSGTTIEYNFPAMGRYRIRVENEDPAMQSCGQQVDAEVGEINSDSIEKAVCLEETPQTAGVDVDRPGSGTRNWQMEFEVFDPKKALVSVTSRGDYQPKIMVPTKGDGRAAFFYRAKLRSLALKDQQLMIRVLSPQGSELCHKEIQLTHHQVSGVSVSGTDGNWVQDRLYPDGQSVEDPLFHDKVVVHAKLQPLPEKPKNIYFSAFDIDDPSDDPAVDLNGSRGYDNRGNPNIGTFEQSVSSTSAQGQAAVAFHATHQPGDNFEMAAACQQKTVEDMALMDANGRALVFPDGSFVPDENISPPFIVWRKLHVERDSMAAADEIVYTGKVKSVSPKGKLSVIELDRNFSDSENEGKEDYFTDGRIVVGAVSLKVLFSSNNPWFLNDEVIVRGNISQDMAGQPYRLYEDDDETLLPQTLDTSLLAEAMKEAFVEVTVEEAMTQNDVPFQRHLGQWEISPADVISAVLPTRQLKPRENYWGVTLLTAFEPGTDEDGDPFSDGWVAGIAEALRGNFNAALFFPEIFREISRSKKIAYEPIVRLVVAHEVGHTQNGQHEDGEIMAAGKANTFQSRHYSGKTIYTLREDKAP